MSEQLHEEIKVSVAPDSGGTMPDIGNYRVLRLLGMGGMGAVYEVEHKLLQQKYALKILSPNRIPDHTTIERFRAEAKAVSGLEHRGLLRIYEFGISEQGQPFFVTDLFAGKSLSDIVKDDGPLDTASAAQLMMQTAAALAHAHEKGVVHRDIKPSNILLKDDHGTIDAKIIDFGIAKQQETSDGQVPATLTATGEIIGTPQYMSPEQCQGVRLDARSDIYSLGCVFYQALTGSAPFTGDNFMHLMMQHMQEVPKDIVTKDKVRKSLAAVTMRCLAKDREKRYQSMAELIADLNAIAGGGTVKRRREVARGFKQRLKIYIPTALLACFVAFAAAAFELWAPPVVLYMHIPIMDRNQAETLVALREANRLRIEGTHANGSIDSEKLHLAEAYLRPYAGTKHDWNFEAAHKLATLYAMEAKYNDMQSIVRLVAGNSELATAHALHNIGVAVDRADRSAQAWPVMNEAHRIFLKTLGENNPLTVKEMFNMAQADLGSEHYARAAQELGIVAQKLKYWMPSLEPQVLDQLKQAQQKSGPLNDPPSH